VDDRVPGGGGAEVQAGPKILHAEVVDFAAGSDQLIEFPVVPLEATPRG
jgi:hypothetical protein